MTDRQREAAYQFFLEEGALPPNVQFDPDGGKTWTRGFVHGLLRRIKAAAPKAK